MKIGLVNDIKISSIWMISEGLGINQIDLLQDLKEILGDDFTLSGLN